MFDLAAQSLTFSPIRHDPARPVALSARNVDFWYGEKHALKDVSLDVHENEVTAFIGPSGCGKSTMLKCYNRMHDITPGARMTGKIELFGEDVNAEHIDPPLLRRRFGWVAQKPNPFPFSIRENIVYGARIAGFCETRASQDELVEQHLRETGLWDEVKDRLKSPGTDLSGGQQQRLCIARALATRPDVLLMDEPCSAIDPIASARVEELIADLRREHTIVIITHNMEQAARIAQKTAYFHLGALLETRDTRDLFADPRTEEARTYLAGKFG